MMKEPGAFLINNRRYSRKELISLAENVVSSVREEKWKKDLYRLILLFLKKEASLLQNTSGTTGDPKILGLRRSAMIHAARRSIEHFNLKSGQSALLCLPVDYIAGKMMVVRALVGGLNLVAIKPSGDPVRNFTKEVDFAAMVPMQVFETLKHPSKILQLKKLIIGGGAIGPDLRKKLSEIEGVDIYETFGMSETYTHFATRKINGADAEEWFQVLKDVELITDERGCASVYIPGVTEEPLVTNDLIRMISPQSFEWLGRIDNVIKSGGIKIIPEILEEKIRKIIEQEAVLIGLPDSKLGDKLVLVVENKKPELPIDDWFASLSLILQKHELPKEVYSLPKLPRNEAGKVIRRMVVEMLISK